MKDRLPNKPGRILITPEDGSAPFYATITRADDPLQEGDELNKANLLKDQTAARYGKGNDSVPDTIFDQIATELDRYAHAQAAGVQIQTGSYVGTGKFGPANPNELTLPFAPAVLMISPLNGLKVLYYFHKDSPYYDIVGATGTIWGSQCAEVDGNTFRWWQTSGNGDATDIRCQANEEGITYYYLAIGYGNTGLDFDRLDYLTLLGDDEEETETTEEEAEA